MEDNEADADDLHMGLSVCFWCLIAAHIICCTAIMNHSEGAINMKDYEEAGTDD